MSDYHISVLLQEVLDGLHVQKGKKYIDATAGGGGHLTEIAKKGGIVLGIDVDDEALTYIRTHLPQELASQVKLAKGNFAHIASIARENDFVPASGILFDLGISSRQVDTGERGFSFQRNGPLDMRMDRNLSVSAKDLVNGLNKGELQELFTKFGEEPLSKHIASAIVEAREQKPIETTEELAHVIAGVYRGKHMKVHPATKVFQALRIAVNDELSSIRDGLQGALSILEENGSIAVISFHSLEDRIVKQTFIRWEREGKGAVITKKPIEPSNLELGTNKRSRSGKLRVFQKI